LYLTKGNPKMSIELRYQFSRGEIIYAPSFLLLLGSQYKNTSSKGLWSLMMMAEDGWT